MAALAAHDFASACLKEFVNTYVDQDAKPPGRAAEWATESRIALELGSVTLRDFSTAESGVPTLLCAPFALHGAATSDFAPKHSLVEALRCAGLGRLFVTDWRSATASMRYFSIDTYLADLNVLVDHLGGSVDMVGLCQGGWLAVVYAARFPAKVRKLVIAGAPIDIAAGDSALSQLAQQTPLSFFESVVKLGNGLVCGDRVRSAWGFDTLTADAIRGVLQIDEPDETPCFVRLGERFRRWNDWTYDLPGLYFLQVVKWLFKENRLATGDFPALGKPIDLRNLRAPLYLLAAENDEFVSKDQLFALQRLVGSSPENIRTRLAPGVHHSLFMGRANLAQVWPEIARWLNASDAKATGEPRPKAGLKPR